MVTSADIDIDAAPATPTPCCATQILTCGDVAALANTCPQLQHLEVYDATVFGPVFSPLHRLASFSSLMLDNVVTTHQHLPVLVSSLVPLTSLTKLGICNMPVLSRSKNLIPLVPSAVPTLLPWLSSLQQLRHLHLEMCPWREDGDFDLKEAGQLLMKHISCLYHLTHIQVRQGRSPRLCFGTPTCKHLYAAGCFTMTSKRQPTADPGFSGPSVRLQLFRSCHHLANLVLVVQTFRVPLLLLGPGSTLLSPCPALACAPNLTELTIKDQVLDTPLIRMFAAMPRLTSLTVKGLRLDTDVSQLRCSLQEVTVSDSISLQQLIWLPRGIQRLQLGQAIRWVLQEGDTLEGACRDLQRAAQLLTESPGWKWLKLQPKLCTTPAFSAPGPQSAGGAQATAWQALCQALAPLLKLLSLVDCTVSEKCALSADAVLQGAKWLPEAHLLIVDPRTPGLGPFLAALGETGWLQSIEFRAVQSVAPLAVGVAQIMFDDGIVDALHRMVEKRTAVAKRLFVSSVMRHLTPAQQASLKQASGYQGGVVEGVVVLR